MLFKHLFRKQFDYQIVEAPGRPGYYNVIADPKQVRIAFVQGVGMGLLFVAVGSVISWLADQKLERDVARMEAEIEQNQDPDKK